jgi:hypothetical protein
MMKPDYEVKLLLQPSAVLGPDHKLTSAVRSALAIPSTVLKMNVQFLDTDGKDIYRNGWCPRVRKTEGEQDFELTYKKRCPVTGGDIDSALATAAAEGFDADATGYEAQIEWGYEKQTLFKDDQPHDRVQQARQPDGRTAEQGLVVPEDGLKTKIIMVRYYATGSDGLSWRMPEVNVDVGVLLR